jgi:hypothetical protein
VLSVARSWQIDFAGQSQGSAITGRQLDAKVNAPSTLSAIAALEEGRSTGDMFPILLSGEGAILAAGIYMQEEDVADAVRQAEAVLADQGDAATTDARHRRYLVRMQQAGASLFEQLPTDLFFPLGEPFRSVREVALPDGTTGELEVLYEASCAAGNKWLDRAVRQVITLIGYSQRRYIEEWGLSEV